MNHLSKTSFNVFESFLCLSNLLFCFVSTYFFLSFYLKNPSYNFKSKSFGKADFSVSDDMFNKKSFSHKYRKNSKLFFEKLLGSFSFFYFFISHYTMFLMSLDRFFAVKFSLKYKIHSLKTSKIAVSVLFLIGFLISLVPILVDDHRLFYYKYGTIFMVPNGNQSLLFLIILYLFPLITSLITNVLCHYFFKKNLKKIYKIDRILTTNQLKLKKREKQLFRTLFSFSAYSITTIIPLFVLFFVSIPLNWNKSNFSEAYIPKLAFFQLYNALFFISIFLLSFNGVFQLFILTKNDSNIKSGLYKIYDYFHYKLVLIKTQLLNCFSFLSHFINILSNILITFYQNVQNIFNNENNYRIEIVPPPRVIENSGRANVYHEAQF